MTKLTGVPYPTAPQAAGDGGIRFRLLSLGHRRQSPAGRKGHPHGGSDAPCRRAIPSGQEQERQDHLLDD